MKSIKLLDKQTGKVGDYDVLLSPIGPQLVEIAAAHGDRLGYSSFEDIARDYEIVPAHQLEDE